LANITKFANCTDQYLFIYQLYTVAFLA